MQRVALFRCARERLIGLRIRVAMRRWIGAALNFYINRKAIEHRWNLAAYFVEMIDTIYFDCQHNLATIIELGCDAADVRHSHQLGKMLLTYLRDLPCVGGIWILIIIGLRPCAPYADENRECCNKSVLHFEIYPAERRVNSSWRGGRGSMSKGRRASRITRRKLRCQDARRPSPAAGQLHRGAAEPHPER